MAKNGEWTPQMLRKLRWCLEDKHLTYRETAILLNVGESTVTARARAHGWMSSVQRRRSAQLSGQALDEQLEGMRARNLSNKDIAEALGLTVRSVERRFGQMHDVRRSSAQQPSYDEINREKGMLERVLADGGYPRAEVMDGRCVWIDIYGNTWGRERWRAAA